MLDDDQLLDELLDNPSDSERYQAALAELMRRADEESDGDDSNDAR